MMKVGKGYTPLEYSLFWGLLPWFRMMELKSDFMNGDNPQIPVKILYQYLRRYYLGIHTWHHFVPSQGLSFALPHIYISIRVALYILSPRPPLLRLFFLPRKLLKSLAGFHNFLWHVLFFTESIK